MREVAQRSRCASCSAGSIRVNGRGGPPVSTLKSALSNTASSCLRSFALAASSGARNASALPATSSAAGAGAPGRARSTPASSCGTSAAPRARTRSATAANTEYSAGVKNRSGWRGTRSCVLRSASGTARALDGLGVADVRPEEAEPPREQWRKRALLHPLWIERVEVVDRGDLVALGHEPPAQVRSDEPRAPGDQHAHLGPELRKARPDRIQDHARFRLVDSRAEPDRLRAVVERERTSAHPGERFAARPDRPIERDHAEVPHVQQVVFLSGRESDRLPAEDQRAAVQLDHLPPERVPNPGVHGERTAHRPTRDPEQQKRSRRRARSAASPARTPQGEDLARQPSAQPHDQEEAEEPVPPRWNT